MTTNTVSPAVKLPNPPHSPFIQNPISPFGKVGACWSSSFSPDGKKLAFISDLNGSPQVWTIPIGGGWPELVTSLKDPIGEVSWSPNGNWLAFAVAPGGNATSAQIFISSPNGQNLRRISDGNQENNWLGPWAPNSRHLLVSSNRSQSGGMDSYLVDIETGEFDLIAKNSGIGYFLDVCESGTDAILAQVESRSNANLFLLDFSQRSKTLLTPHEGPASIGDAKFSSKGRAVYFSSDIQQEMTAFCRISLSEQKTPGPLEVLLARPDGYLEAFEISKDGSKAVLCWNMAGHNEIELFDLKTLERHEGPKLPAERASFPTLSRDGNLLALELSGPASPKDIHVFNLKDPSSWQVTHSPHPGLDLSTLVRPQLLRFSSHDGLELSGWLFLPTRYNPPGPLVMSFHGGPEAQERPDFRADYQALLTQGIAVFAPNVRGSVGFGKTFANLDNGVLRHNAILDIKSCAEFVIKSRFADPKKIGIMGESYGGYMTLAGVTEFPDLFAAGADLFGIVNFETFFKNTEPWMADISKVKYGDPETQKDLLRRLSPIHQLDRVTAPTIVLHGANDKNVPVDESKQVVESLKKNGIPTELVVFQDEGHGFLKEPNRIQATIAVVDWFSKYLLK